MKKILILVLINLISYSMYAQDYKDSDYYYYDGIENYNEGKITSEQKSKIIAIKKNIGRRHAAIGKSGLRGYEKGQAHRQLNLEIRKEIAAVLNSDQIASWDNKTSDTSSYNGGRYNSWRGKNNKLENQIDALEDEIDDMEDYYDNLIDKVENDRSLSKTERKAKKNELKAEKKSKKREMKREKQTLKDSRVY